MENQHQNKIIKNLTDLQTFSCSGVYVAANEKQAAVFEMIQEEFRSIYGAYHEAKNADFLYYGYAILIGETEELSAGLYVPASLLSYKRKMNYPFPYAGKKRTDLEIEAAVKRAGVADKKELKEIWRQVEFKLGWFKGFTDDMKQFVEIRKKNEQIKKKDDKKAFIEKYITSIPGIVEMKDSWGNSEGMWKYKFDSDPGAYVTISLKSWGDYTEYIALNGVLINSYNVNVEPSKLKNALMAYKEFYMSMIKLIHKK